MTKALAHSPLEEPATADRAAAVPGAVRPYVEAIGVDASVDLLLAFGGAELYIAETPGVRSKVAALIGPEKARALGRVLGRGSIRVPTAKRWLAGELKRRDWTVADIARRLKVADWTVRRWLGPAPSGDQLDLF